MRTQGFSSVVIALLVCGLVSCSAAEKPSDGPSGGAGQQAFHLDDREVKTGEDLQAKLLADGSVSRGDYEQAVKAVGGCFTRHGLQFTDEGWDPVGNQTIDFTFGNPKLSEDEVLGYGDGCQKVYLEKIQESFETSSKPSMDPAVLAASQKCLAGLGIPISKNEKNVEDLVASAGKTGFNDVIKCVKVSAQKFYPHRSIHVGG
jgi:hypothetical protein